jgi:hypothetical protein
MPYVFVSHANPDKASIRPLIEALLDAGIELWIDRPEEIGLGKRHLLCGRILAGKDWRREIDRALEGCSCVLFVLSKHSNSYERSDVLVREFEYGKGKELLVIAQIGTIEYWQLNPFFRTRQSIDIYGDPAEGDGLTLRPDKLQILIADLQRYLCMDTRHLKSSLAPAREAASANSRLRAAAADSAGSQRRPPRLVPYLADRQDQHRRFTDELQRHFDSPVKKPLVFLAYGSDMQCVDSFIEQLYLAKLPQLLEANSLPNDVLQRTLNWPHADHPVDKQQVVEHFRELEEQAKGVFGLKPNGDKSLVPQKFRKLGMTCFFDAAPPLLNWSEGHVKLLKQWIDFWAGLDLKGIAYPVVTVIGLAHSPHRVFGNLFNARKLRQVRRDFERLKQERSASATIVDLPELQDVRYEDVVQWIADNVHDYDREVLRREIRQHFTGRFGQRRLPMYLTAEAVKAALKDPRAQAVMT